MFKVGDLVRVRAFSSIPESKIVREAGDSPFLWSSRKATACGKTAEIVDAYDSERYGTRVYRLRIGERKTDSQCLFLDEDLARVGTDVPNWDIRFETAENLVIARLYIDGVLKAQGHGHVFHDDEAGYVQAASYAVKKIWLKFDEYKDRKDQK